MRLSGGIEREYKKTEASRLRQRAARSFRFFFFLTKIFFYTNITYVIIYLIGKHRDERKGVAGMARKISITKEMLIQNAFEAAREEGLMQVTARKLAAKVGCSTQPIFRVYGSMEEVYDEVYQCAVAYFSDFYGGYQGDSRTPFVNLGMAYIGFAAKEPQLFRMLFMETKRCGVTLFGILNGKTNELHREIARAKEDGAKDPGNIFMKMWIFIHGAACMMMTGDYDLSKQETEALLEASYQSFVRG